MSAEVKNQLNRILFDKNKFMYFINKSRYFSTIAYSADGETLLAAGKSKNVCIYHVAGGILLKKLEITQNHSLDGLDVRQTAFEFNFN